MLYVSSQKLVAKTLVKELFPPVFSFRIFIVSDLVFRSNLFLADFFVQYRIAVQFNLFFFSFGL